MLFNKNKILHSVNVSSLKDPRMEETQVETRMFHGTSETSIYTLPQAPGDGNLRF